MARLFLDERNLREAGVSEQNIRTMRALTEFANLAADLANTQEELETTNTAVDAAQEAIEAAELSLTSLDTRVDTLETFQAAGPYAKLAGGAGAVFIGGITGTTLGLSGALTAASADFAGEARCNSFRIDQTPTAETITPTHTMTISVDGTNYKVALQAA